MGDPLCAHALELVKSFVPLHSILLDPRRLFLQPAHAELAGAHAPDLLRRDEAGLLEDADVLHHARQGHLEPLGEVRDRSIRASKLLENATPRGIRERGERGVERRTGMIYHSVKYAPM